MARISSLVSQSIRRNKRDFIFSSIGIIVGIGTLLFFTALGSGIKRVVLEQVFVIGQLEVVKPSVGVSLFGASGPTLGDDTVERFKTIDGVKGVYPKMKLTFPASARGGAALIGKDIWAELIADGIPPGLVRDDVLGEGAMAFEDWDARSCDAGCPTGYECSGDLCVGKTCSEDADCGEKVYCVGKEEKRCEIPIPVVISPALLEIYNGSVHTAMKGATGGMSKMPKLSADGLVGLEFDGVFGRSYLGRSAKGKVLERRMRLVGFSHKAINLGATMPIGYVKRLNKQFRSDEASKEYHSILVDTVSNERVAEVAKAITDTGFALSDKYENAQRAGLLILLMTLVFNLISLIILAIAAVNIMHTFLMIVLERRRELALMRAVGATRPEIQMLVYAEAVVLGVVGGLIGTALGFAITLGVDWIFATQVADFPFKPDSLFLFEAWMFFAAIGVSVLFCLIGAAVPAFRASRIDPAAALSGM